MRCEEVRDLAPELALGIADGAERAEALRHLSACAECRRALEQLSQVADELLVLA
jgi:Putative zinc-finger